MESKDFYEHSLINILRECTSKPVFTPPNNLEPIFHQCPKIVTAMKKPNLDIVWDAYVHQDNLTGWAVDKTYWTTKDLPIFQNDFKEFRRRIDERKN